VIGAGISGIIASIRLPQRVLNLSLQIYEKNSDIGGTWFENRYPGCACDIPAHTYQATFEPNHEWSQFYASSKEIHQYWKKVALKYDCMRHIKLNHQVLNAIWDDRSAKWQLEVCVTPSIKSQFANSPQIKNVANNTTFEDACDVLVSATGALNDWNWPSIPGQMNFKGKLLHSASWDQSYDWTVNQ
jgi:cation diffusion facilitator CzcD-associated flavoprotein CzcO